MRANSLTGEQAPEKKGTKNFSCDAAFWGRGSRCESLKVQGLHKPLLGQLERSIDSCESLGEQL